jgi:hypothetical protein
MQENVQKSSQYGSSSGSSREDIRCYIMVHDGFSPLTKLLEMRGFWLKYTLFGVGATRIVAPKEDMLCV